MMNFDVLQSFVMRARERARGFFGRAVLNQSPIKAYALWADLPKRKRAPMANTRQCQRAEFRRRAMASVNEHHGAEPRKARRKIARQWAKTAWQGPAQHLAARQQAAVA